MTVMLFDFDGTIVDSLNCVVEKANSIAERFRFRKIKQHEIEVLRNLSSQEVVKFLDLPLHLIPLVIYQLRKALYEAMHSLRPITNIRNVLEQIYQSKITLAIVTTNSISNVERWLQLNNMSYFFQFIQSESRTFSKKSLLKRIIAHHNIDITKAFYVGDETRDIHAAHYNNIQSIAVTWGYNSESILIKYKPTYIARQPQDLLKILGIKRCG
jgi:phosphoglycolate phosphatase